MEKPIPRLARSFKFLMATAHIPSMKQIMKRSLEINRAENNLLILCEDRELAEACISLTRLLGHDTWRGLHAIVQICQRGAASREDVLQIVSEAAGLLRSPQTTLFISKNRRIPWSEFKQHLIDPKDVQALHPCQAVRIGDSLKCERCQQLWRVDDPRPPQCEPYGVVDSDCEQPKVD